MTGADLDLTKRVEECARRGAGDRRDDLRDVHGRVPAAAVT